MAQYSNNKSPCYNKQGLLLTSLDYYTGAYYLLSTAALTIAAKAAGSRTAKSANVLRSN